MGLIKNILGIVLLLFPTILSAQSRYALSLEDYMNERWTTVENLTIKSRSKTKKIWNGGADFIPKTGNKAVDKILKKEAKFIIHQDTLYVNCRVLRHEGCKFGSWYAPGYRYGTDKVAFISMRVGRKESNEAVVTGMMFGMIGGLVSASNQINNRTCYLIASDDKQVMHFTQKRMKSILLNFPEYAQQYRAVKDEKKESAAVIIEFLNKANLLMRY